MAEETRALIRLAAALTGAALLSGCFSRSPRPEERQDVPVSPQPPGTAPPATPGMPPSAPHAPPTQRANNLSPATRALVTQTRTLISRGDLDGASSTLDRALRIEPNNPLLWIERGRLRLAENDAHQAESCGRKALSLASGDRKTQVQAGRLLADALRAQGRNQEAVEVERRPFMQ